MSQGLVGETEERTENDRRIQTIVSSEIKKLDEILFDLKQIGEATDKKLYDAIKTTVNEIKITLDNEKNKR